MRKFCLIGHPLGHSLSPQIHERLFALAGRDGEYTLRDTAPEVLKNEYSALEEYEGFNITIPHKMAIIEYCDELSDEAGRYNSVNCVKNGAKKVGYNTDCIGFVKSIEMLGADLKSKVLLIGCGGVGRMAAIETALQGGELTVAVLKSDIPLAEKTIAEISAQNANARVRIAEIGEGGLTAKNLGGEKFDLLINSTPVGMFPKTDRMPCGADVLENAAAVFDVIYNPCETLLAKTAREMGKPALTGMAMLVLQAAAAHEIWDGSSYSKADIDAIIAEMEALV